MKNLFENYKSNEKTQFQFLIFSSFCYCDMWYIFWISDLFWYWHMSLHQNIIIYQQMKQKFNCINNDSNSANYVKFLVLGTHGLLSIFDILKFCLFPTPSVNVYIVTLEVLVQKYVLEVHIKKVIQFKSIISMVCGWNGLKISFLNFWFYDFFTHIKVVVY